MENIPSQGQKHPRHTVIVALSNCIFHLKIIPTKKINLFRIILIMNVSIMNVSIMIVALMQAYHQGL